MDKKTVFVREYKTMTLRATYDHATDSWTLEREECLYFMGNQNLLSSMPTTMELADVVKAEIRSYDDAESERTERLEEFAPLLKELHFVEIT